MSGVDEPVGSQPTRAVSSWVIASVVAGAAFLAIMLSPEAPAPIIRGATAPLFSLPRLDGSEAIEIETLRGRVVLLNFWATWCKPCEDEMPAMERLYQELRPEGFELLAISVDEAEESVREFQGRLGLSFPILMDPGQDVAKAYQAYRFPESLLVDRGGTVIERYIGPRDWDAEAYVGRIRRLLHEGG